MNKDWLDLNRSTNEYMNAAWAFVERASHIAGNPEKILCPCKNCRNLSHHRVEDVYEHLVIKGMDPTYTNWYHHGEQSSAAENSKELGTSDAYDLYSAAYAQNEEYEEPDHKIKDEEFVKSLEDAETPLYPSCLKYTKLSAVVTLYRLKAKNGWSDKSFSELLAVVQDMLPEDNVMLRSMYSVRKFLKPFELGYEKIHACVKDCCLFRKENAELENCPKCGASRWKEDVRTKKIKKGVPAKVLIYFPIIPKFRSMFRSSEMAQNLTWHSTHKSKDGKMRHPVDSPFWDTINDKWPSFSADPRNLRLGLASDGFNPFGNLSSTYSCWPVMLVAYNLPPWLWMKRENVMLTLLIPGPKQPGNDIDVYLQPLIEDLHCLWNDGVNVYDGNSGSDFNLRAILMWTINDFPAYGNLAGCVTKGKNACPICGENTHSQWLKCSRKTVYMGHRRFLPEAHPLRNKKSWFNGKVETGKKPRIMSGIKISLALKDFKNDWGKVAKGKGAKRKRTEKQDAAVSMWKKRSIFFNLPYWQVSGIKLSCNKFFNGKKFSYRKSWFNGKVETGKKPRIMSGIKISLALKDFKNDWGKVAKGKGAKRKRTEKQDAAVSMWKKRSIFFNLPYWQELPLRHNLDVMHIEKNVLESILGTLLDIKGKSKDGVNARMDLQDLELQKGSVTLSKVEKRIFCKRLFDLKLPDGYSSNVGNCVSVEECKVTGLKSHDCHVLMQQLLPVALRGLLTKGPRNAIFRLCAFFNTICQRVMDREEIAAAEDQLVETLCMLERFCTPSFFDIMVHLTIHLGREARICGPVHYRWMYLFERQMKIFKGYVKNRARPEGCIAQWYLAEECVAFCSTYMKKSLPQENPRHRNQDFDSDVILEGRPISAGKSITLTDDLVESAHHYVLFNTAIVEPYLQIHVEELKQSNKDLALQKNRSLLWKRHTDNFSKWLKEKIQSHAWHGNELDRLKWFANGPRKHIMSYTGYIINGQRFHTKDYEKSTQNSGVFYNAETMCRASVRDTAQVIDNVSYFGVIKDIILLDYHTFQVPLFKCDWAKTGHGVKIEDGFTLVNLHQGQNQYSKEPFILASQAKQVFYSRESDSSNWYVVLKAPPRGFYDLELFEENAEESYGPQDVSAIVGMNMDEDEDDDEDEGDCDDTSV